MLRKTLLSDGSSWMVRTGFSCLPCDCHFVWATEESEYLEGLESFLNWCIFTAWCSFQHWVVIASVGVRTGLFSIFPCLFGIQSCFSGETSTRATIKRLMPSPRHMLMTLDFFKTILHAYCFIEMFVLYSNIDSSNSYLNGCLWARLDSASQYASKMDVDKSILKTDSIIPALLKRHISLKLSN